MVRGSIVWVALDPVRGAEVPKTRPCVVVSRDTANEIAPTLTVVPLSSLKGKPSERLVQPILPARDSRLPKDSRALCDQVRTIDKARVRGVAGRLGVEIMQRIDLGLILHLHLDPYLRS